MLIFAIFSGSKHWLWKIKRAWILLLLIFSLDMFIWWSFYFVSLFVFLQTPLFISSCVDGVFFPKSPRQLLSEKAMNAVPYIIGVNNCEFGWVIPEVRDLQWHYLDMILDIRFPHKCVFSLPCRWWNFLILQTVWTKKLHVKYYRAPLYYHLRWETISRITQCYFFTGIIPYSHFVLLIVIDEHGRYSKSLS